MIYNLNKLRGNRQSEFQKLSSKISQLNKGGYAKEEDETYWTLTVDKAGNGYAVIRFLPAPEGEEEAWVRYWDHAFEGPGGWYIEKSLTTFGQDVADPCGEYNAMIWHRNNPGDRDFVSGTPGKPGSKRRMHIVSNIEVIEDPANKANNGKVFKYKYGAKIFEKIDNATNPKFPNIPRLNVFDPDLGANFNLVATVETKGKQKFRNYSESSFLSPSPIGQTDEEIIAVLSQCYPLQPIIGQDKFKTYNELKTKLYRVLAYKDQDNGLSHSGSSPLARTVEDENVMTMAEPKSSSLDETPPWVDSDDDDETLAKFQKLAQK